MIDPNQILEADKFIPGILECIPYKVEFSGEHNHPEGHIKVVIDAESIDIKTMKNISNFLTYARTALPELATEVIRLREIERLARNLDQDLSELQG